MGKCSLDAMRTWRWCLVRMLVWMHGFECLEFVDGPDLVVFEVFQGNLVQPGHFFIEAVVQSEQDFGSVDPATC